MVALDKPLVMKGPNSWNSDMMIHRTPKRYPVISLWFKYIIQRAKKVVSDSTGLVDIAIGLVNSVLNLPDGQVKFFLEFKLQKNCESSLLINTVLGLVEMMFGLVIASFSLPNGKL